MGDGGVGGGSEGEGGAGSGGGGGEMWAASRSPQSEQSVPVSQ